MSKKESFYPLLFAVFGFMMIIATGVDLLIGSENIPIIVSIIGLILILIAMYLRKRKN
jgi:LPXTG-motif cell wall-anchored protein